MASDQQKINYAMAYLRRTKTVAELKVLADKVAASVLADDDHVVITSNSFVGGSASGEVRFPADIVGQAIEILLAELAPEDTQNPAGDVAGRYVDFSCNPLRV